MVDFISLTKEVLKASRYVVAIGSEDLKSFYHLIRTLGLEKDDSRWTRDLWSKGVSLILAYLYRFLSFCGFDDIFRLKKNYVFGIGATICIGREILCLPYAGFFV